MAMKIKTWKMKFGAIVEKYESEYNGRVIFTVIDNKNNRMSDYELEDYNKGDEESICTYRMYCNTDCKVINITHDKMWVNVVWRQFRKVEIL